MPASSPALVVSRSDLRVGDAERQAAVARLQPHFVAGRLTDEELGERVAQVLAARTAAGLDAPFHDLPPGVAETASDGPEGGSVAAAPGFRTHLAAYLLVMGLLVAIWLVSTPGGSFWPAWPMLGWGIGVLSHATGRGRCGQRSTFPPTSASV